MSALPNLIFRFNKSLIKTPTKFYEGLNKLILKFIWKRERQRIDKTLLKKNTESLIVIKIVWYWHRDRHIDQWNRIKSPEMRPHIFENFIYDNGGTVVKWGNNGLSNKWSWDSYYSNAERKRERELDISHHITHQIHSRWIKDVCKRDTLKTRERKKNKSLQCSSRQGFCFCFLIQIKNSNQKRDKLTNLTKSWIIHNR